MKNKKKKKYQRPKLHGPFRSREEVLRSLDKLETSIDRLKRRKP